MLKTLLYYWYECEELPYKTPPHYYFNDSQDTSEACQKYIRILYEWKRQMAQSLPKDQFRVFLRQGRAFFEMSEKSRYSLTQDIYEDEDHWDFMKYLEAKIIPYGIVINWYWTTPTLRSIK